MSRNTRVEIALLTVLIIVGGLLLILKRPDSLKENDLKVPISTNVSEAPPFLPEITWGTFWQKQLPQIGMVLRETFKDISIGIAGPPAIREERDVTNDGMLDALVHMGVGGAYTDYLTLLKIENGKPTPILFREKTGETTPKIFLSGASVRHGSEVRLSEEFIYEVTWSTSEKNMLAECASNAYKQNRDTGIFEWNDIVSGETTTNFCAEIQKELRNS
ncbi:MAG: hypothetical protein FJY98_04445 [Candidatus Liptonbacteria bacterium]|nr:hypothetical protein [Candidatus Liptonbacteria bacterium]